MALNFINCKLNLIVMNELLKKKTYQSLKNSVFHSIEKKPQIVHYIQYSLT